MELINIFIAVLCIILVLFLLCSRGGDSVLFSGNGEFPSLSNFKKLPESYYSSPGPYHVAQEIKLFKSLFSPKKKLEIIDATAHIGVDSMALAYSFPKSKVTSIERNPDTFKVLKHNIKKLGYSRQITPINSSADTYLETTKNVDLVYMDPPWGGKGYIPTSDLPLHDKDGKASIPLSGVVNLALKKTNTMVLKAPYNFLHKEFEKKINGKIMKIVKIQYRDPIKRAKRPIFILMVLGTR